MCAAFISQAPAIIAESDVNTMTEFWTFPRARDPYSRQMLVCVLVMNQDSSNNAWFLPFQGQIGECLRRSGVSVLQISICNLCAFLAAAIIPIPALRAFAFQAAVLTAVNLFTMLTLFPAALALDLRRVKSGRVDLLCCYKAPQNPSVAAILKEKRARKEDRGESALADESQQRLSKLAGSGKSAAEEAKEEAILESAHSPPKWSLDWFAARHYGYWITRSPVKVVATTMAISLTVFGVYGAFKMEDGLRITDVVPRNTTVYRFLSAQSDYFGFYNMYAVTQGHFEYPQNQALLYDYHNAFVRVPSIIKDDDGGLPEFWLSLFRTWLTKLQSAFDEDYASGAIYEGGWHRNASEYGVMAYKLMVQTGHVDYPVDETLLLRSRLVDSHGIINPSAFYNYLSAWYSNDAMAYSFSQVNIVPTPKEWLHDARDTDLRVPKSQPIAYAQIPFYLGQVGETETIVAAITQIRAICQRFESERGLPNFPRGFPFTFWEQYLTLRFWLAVALASILAAVFIVLAFVLWNARLGGVVVVVIALLLVQLVGFMSAVGIRLSAIPAVILIIAAGLGVQFTLHVCMVRIEFVAIQRRVDTQTFLTFFAGLPDQHRQQEPQSDRVPEAHVRSRLPRRRLHLCRHSHARLLPLRLHIQVRTKSKTRAARESRAGDLRHLISSRFENDNRAPSKRSLSVGLLRLNPTY